MGGDGSWKEVGSGKGGCGVACGYDVHWRWEYWGFGERWRAGDAPFSTQLVFGRFSCSVYFEGMGEEILGV